MMYKMMKWWGGKPHNIWAEYIATYSNEGDIVLDPFCGRGTGVTEASILGRKAIGVDLNPIAIFQARMILQNADVEKIKSVWSSMKEYLNKCEKESGIFNTKCIKCGKMARLGTMNYDNGVPYGIYYLCGCSKKPLFKEPGKTDSIDSEQIVIDLPYPKDKFPKSTEFNMARKNYGDTYDTLFTKRNMYALSVIFDYIRNKIDSEVRDFFLFAFISMIHIASKIPSVRENSNRVLSGSWGRPGYIKVRKNMELNPFMLFERAIIHRQGIISGKTSSNKRLKNPVKFAKNITELKKDKNILLLNENTAELSNIIPESSVDCVITDPPYGGLIQYFDLSFIWAAWMQLHDSKFIISFDDEITLDDKKDKPFEEYHRMLSISFSEIYKVLKPDKYMIVTFHNDKPKIFNSILRACQDNGFVLETILFQMNRRPGETGAASPWGTSVSDFYIRFFKPKEKPQKTKEFVPAKFEMIVKSEAKKIIAMRGEPTEISAMIPHIYTKMAKNGMRIEFKENDQISPILHGDGDFIELPNKQWWLSEDARRKHKLGTPLSERVESAVISIIQKEYKVSYDEVLASVFSDFPNSLTPNTENIKEYLGHYATKTSDGKWKMKPGLHESDVKREHTEMESILCKLGVKFGYRVWCPDRNKDKEMKELCEDFQLDAPNADRIKHIDVLWIKDGIIKYAFEVENSTSITSALERCSHISTSDVNRVIVIPKEREVFLERKKKEPMFVDYFKKGNWKVLWYADVRQHGNKSERALLELAK